MAPMKYEYERKNMKSWDFKDCRPEIKTAIAQFEDSYKTLLDYRQLTEMERFIFESAYRGAVNRFIGMDWGKYSEIEVRIYRKPTEPRIRSV